MRPVRITERGPISDMEAGRALRRPAIARAPARERPAAADEAREAQPPPVAPAREPPATDEAREAQPPPAAPAREPPAAADEAREAQPQPAAQAREPPAAADEAREAQPQPAAQAREPPAAAPPPVAPGPAVVLSDSPSAPEWPLALAAAASKPGQAARPESATACRLERPAEVYRQSRSEPLARPRRLAARPKSAMAYRPARREWLAHWPQPAPARPQAA
jgi:hypothetical protein